MSAFALLSVINNDVRIYQVSNDQIELENILEETAVGYVCDNVGKNNYQDTLKNNLPLEKCPPGFVLKYEQVTQTEAAFSPSVIDAPIIAEVVIAEAVNAEVVEAVKPVAEIAEVKPVAEVTKSISIYTKCIKLFMNKETIDAGWIYNAKKIETANLGFFAVMPIDKPLPVIEKIVTVEVQVEKSLIDFNFEQPINIQKKVAEKKNSFNISKQTAANYRSLLSELKENIPDPTTPYNIKKINDKDYQIPRRKRKNAKNFDMY